MVLMFVIVGLTTILQDSVWHEIQTLPNGIRVERYLTPPNSTSEVPLRQPRNPSHLLSQTLWVDRNHQYAIVYSLGIDTTGNQIVAGWGLNNQRVSHYLTSDDGVPDWSYYKENPIYWASNIMVSLSRNSWYLGVTYPGEPVDLLSLAGPNPLLSLNPAPGYVGILSAVSPDGSQFVFADYGPNGYRIEAYSITDLSSPQLLWTVDRPSSYGGVYGLNYSPDGSVIVFTQYSKITIIDAQSGGILGELVNSSQTEAKASTGGEYVAFGNFSGLVFVYQWNGTSYSLAYYASLGSNTWVTAIDITPDGNTIVAGTFRYSPSYSGEVYYFRRPTGSPPASLDLRWTYSNYGDYVADVEVSDDGSVLIAGSWGTYGSTYGDVITILDSSGGVVHAVLDDIDEPGSCFTVDISQDGRFAIAGGKAVHAREFGNGGFLYAFRIIDPYDYDIAISSIVSPPYDLQVGQSSNIQAIVSNIGNQPSNSFYLVASVSNLTTGAEVLLDSVLVQAMQPGEVHTVTVGSFTPSEYGIYETVVIARSSPDGDPQNNRVVRQSVCYHDLAVLNIQYPFSETSVGYSQYPRARIKNMGSYPESDTAYCQISAPDGTTVYGSSYPFYLNPHTDLSIAFTDLWAPSDTGTYTIKVWTNAADDFNPINDTMITTTHATNELLYDDGQADAFYIVSSTYEGNMFAIRYLPPIPGPYTPIRARVYVNQTTPLIFTVNPDMNGLPDTSHTLLGPDTVVASTAPGWAEHVWEASLPDLDTIWLLIHWLPSSPSSPGVGADANDPIDLQSYWFSYSQNWNQWTNHDWMARLYLNYPLAIEENEPKNLTSLKIGYPKPNPSTGIITLNMSLPDESITSFYIFDITGRLVWTKRVGPISPGSHKFILNPDVRSGVYFLKVEAGSNQRIFKVLLTR